MNRPLFLCHEIVGVIRFRASSAMCDARSTEPTDLFKGVRVQTYLCCLAIQSSRSGQRSTRLAGVKDQFTTAGSERRKIRVVRIKYRAGSCSEMCKAREVTTFIGSVRGAVEETHNQLCCKASGCIRVRRTLMHGWFSSPSPGRKPGSVPS